MGGELQCEGKRLIQPTDLLLTVNYRSQVSADLNRDSKVRPKNPRKTAMSQNVQCFSPVFTDLCPHRHTSDYGHLALGTRLALVSGMTNRARLIQSVEAARKAREARVLRQLKGRHLTPTERRALDDQLFRLRNAP